MDKEKVIKELEGKYPGKKILENKGEIVRETNPAKNPGGGGVAVAVIDRSLEHYHKKTVETYKVLKGELTVFKNNKPYELRAGDELTVNTGEIHYATGNETWVEVAATPGWTIKDHFFEPLS
ncbi:MAG: cupin domain-containing protein [Candidatus Paceibacterota bacterium]